MMNLLDRARFLAENPEVYVQSFNATEAAELVAEYDKLCRAIEGESAAYQAGYEEALEDLNSGTIPMWIVGLLDEVEFMGQEPERHGITVRGPFFSIDLARANARTMSTDPDEAVIVPVKI